MTSVVETERPSAVREEPSAKYVGRPLRRFEDTRFMTGSAQYLDDLRVSGSLHAAMLRSPYAHARIKSIDASEAEKLPGVIAVVTGEDAKTLTKPFVTIPNAKRIVTPNVAKKEGAARRSEQAVFEEYGMAVGKAIFEGDVVAAVAATDKYIAADAVELIKVDYDVLPAVTDPEAAIRPDSPLLYEKAGTNLVLHDHLIYGDVERSFEDAQAVVSERFTVHRYASTPIEKFGCICNYSKDTGKITVWSNTQELLGMIKEVPHAFGIDEGDFRLIVPDIGGAYGNKKSIFDVIVVTLLSMKSGRPVGYVQTEREMLAAMAHTCNEVFYVDIAATKNGVIQALRTREFFDEGASPKGTGLHVATKVSVTTGNYRIPNLEMEAYSVITNKCRSGPNRAVGKPGTTFFIERIIDLLAKKLGIDRLEIRRRNFIQPQELPFTTPTGNVYDSGDYPGALKLALERVHYEQLKKQQEELRKEGKYIGIGVACAVQSATSFNPRGGVAPPSEVATVRVLPSGKVVVYMGSESSGQGHETVVAQIVADELGVIPASVSLIPGFDSETQPWTRYAGRYANKFAVVDSAAVVHAARKVRAKILKVAASMLGVSENDISIQDGRVFVRSDRAKSLSIKEVAERAHKNLEIFPQDSRSGLAASYVYVSPFGGEPDAEMKFKCHITFANSVHVPIVEVDIETGEVKILRYVAVEDAGTIINPLLLEGQVQGSISHGLSATMGEEFVYDSDGHLLSATYMDYGKPTIAETPRMEIYHMESPSPFSVLGSKGAGEGGAIPPLAALASAVEDALEPFGAKVTQLPLNPENVLKLIRQSK